MRNCDRIAADMLAQNGDGKPARIHPDLLRCLHRIDDLAAMAGGELGSRQVIATAIFVWQNTNPTVAAYEQKGKDEYSPAKARS